MPTQSKNTFTYVTSLAEPLPILQISKLLGRGEGRDVEIVLVQLWSVMDIPGILPASIFQ